MVKLSIVIPYYETYELTRKLLISLIAQLPFEAEIILVDDGCYEKRFDDYLEFLNTFGFDYTNNIHIVHQENTGVAGARNKGIELAQGEYIAFIDSDDMVMPDYIETLLHLIDEREENIIVFNWLDINTNQIVRHPCNPSVWKAIYKKEIIPRFEECYRTREDYFFNEELDRYGYNKFYYDRVLYIYNSGRENSLTWKEANQ